MSSENYTQPHSHLDHPLPRTPIPALQPQHQHRRKEQIPQQAYQVHGDDHQHQSDTPDPVRYGLMRISCAVDMAVHGTIVILSVYAFVSIISTPDFRSNHHKRSSPLIVLFLLFVAGVSFMMALAYMGLAWWARTVAGLHHIRSYYQQRLTAASSEKPTAGPQSSTATWMRVVVFLMRPCPRMCIQIGLVSMSLSAAILQSRKLWTSSHCRIIPLEHRQFCETAKAVLVTYLTASVWMLWAVWCFFKTVYKAGGAHGAGDMDTEAQQQQQRGMQEEGENGRREGDVLIPIPGSYSGGTADMKIVVAGAASVGAGIAESSMQGHSHQQNHQQHQQAQQNLPQSKNLQQTSVTNTVASAENGKILTDPGSVSSLGLGIDMLPPKTDNHTTLDKMHPNSVSLNGVNDADKNTTNSNSDPTRSYSKINCIGSSSTGNITHSRSTAIVAQNTVAAFVQPAGDRSRSNSNGSFMSSSNNGNAINVARLRDHAKVFDIPRSRSGSIHEAAYHSSRDTPPSHSNARDKFPVPATPSNNQSVDFSPSISTPDTPLTRGEIGYMGVHTAKVFNSNGGIPGTGSMGHVAAFNNGGPGGPSAQSSPQAGPLDTVRTPSSARSYGSMSSFFGPGSALPSGGGANYPQTPAEVEAAEQSMDEYLKAVRRRSFATNSLLMNSEGPTSFTTAAMFGVGASPSPTTPTRGAFRTSLSSPNLNTTRRRSSLMSVLSSIVSTPVDPSSSSISSCSTSSDLSSPRSITSPICDDAEEADDVTAFEGQKKRPQSVSAQDLLRAEYGDLYCGVTDRNGKHVMEPEQPNSNGFTPVPAPSRSRSSSVSSNRTSSSGSSESSSSTTSNTTSLSNDEKPATTNNITRPTSVTSGPPLTFRNKTLVGSYRSTDVNQMRHHHSQRQQQNHQKQGVLRRAGSSGNFKKDVTGMQRSGSMTSSLKNFPSQGGLTEQFII